jgi:serine/threonine protein kinase
VALPNERVLPPPTQQGRLARQAGAEPIPGYRLIEPLGSGGFGEVWKCLAPGGLMKAVKFVGGEAKAGGSLASQEFEAIERIKSIRHPFLLSLERVEVVDGVLVLVMELADRNLQNVLLDYQRQGLPGIPRSQLLGFLEEAAEALDVINFEHGLQHLDVKPHNLFVVSNHVKVADFGLVHRLPGVDSDPSAMRRGGATPLYASPETLQGSLSRHSDQYSLAIVYQQLLTGTVPYWSANPYQLLLQHVSGKPNLSAVPPKDQPLMARALAKSPERRFASCIDFVRALVEVSDSASGVRPNLRSLQAESIHPALREENRPSISPGAQADQRTVSGLTTADLARVTLANAPLPPIAANPLHLPQPSGISLPGYRFSTCVGRTPLGCLWTVEAPDGKERLGHCLLNVGEFTTETLTRLQTLRHPALPAREVFWMPPGCLVLISDPSRQTLRDRFDQCRADGLPGVPRQALLNYLAAAAESLDDLNKTESLPHLGLTPAHLLLEGDRVLLEDFGLAPLLWLGRGAPVAQLNPKYAAPELCEPISSPTADQYSLALIYTEMFTGISPRTNTKAGKSGQHRRPNAAETGSGQHRRPALSSYRQTGAAGANKVDLDFLPPDDRPVVARALDANPDHRFPTCTAFVESLRAATPCPAVTEEMLASLPLVTPFACLIGKAPPQGTIVPLTSQVTAALIATAVGAVSPCEVDNIRYIVHPDGAWEYRFPIRMFASLMRLKLEGFRQHWNAEPAPPGGNSFAFKIRTSNGKPGFWSLSKRTPVGVEMQVRFQPANATDANQREAVVRMGLFGDHGALKDTLLPSTAPRLFQSLRAYLQGGADQRGRERWSFTQRVGVYPVLAPSEIGRVLEGRGRDISLDGARLQVPQEPPSEYAYLHFHETATAAAFAILSRIGRVQPLEDGAYELGLTFAAEGSLDDARP